MWFLPRSGCARVSSESRRGGTKETCGELFGSEELGLSLLPQPPDACASLARLSRLLHTPSFREPSTLRLGKIQGHLLFLELGKNKW